MEEIPGFWAGALDARVRPSPEAVERLGGWGAVADGGVDALVWAGLTPEAARRWVHSPPKRTQGRFVTIADPAYPPRMKEDPLGPLVLCYEGELGLLHDDAIAVVGTRDCTGYGGQVARHLGASFAARGVAVVSGLALGIDSYAHRGAIARTVAVLGHGLSFTAPLQHSPLRRAILEAGGCVLTAFADDIEPRPHTFPTRNQWIAAASRLVVVVEAPSRSGALLTAAAAERLVREVYAVPGPLGAPASRGCLDALRTGAKVVWDVDDFVATVTATVAASPDGWQLALFAGRPVEAVARLANRTTAELLADLGRLEVSGAVVRLPGGRFAPG